MNQNIVLDLQNKSLSIHDIDQETKDYIILCALNDLVEGTSRKFSIKVAGPQYKNPIEVDNKLIQLLNQIGIMDYITERKEGDGWFSYSTTMDFDKELEKIYDELLEDNYLQYTTSSNFERERNIFYSIIESLYYVKGDIFEISNTFFQGDKQIQFSKMLMVFMKMDFVIIMFSNPVIHEGYLSYKFNIKITDQFKEIINTSLELKNQILNRVFDEKYKQITIKKKRGEITYLESEISIYGNDKKFIDLKSEYPFSKIEAEVHEGKTNKYTVTEKIKLKKDNK